MLKTLASTCTGFLAPVLLATFATSSVASANIVCGSDNLVMPGAVTSLNQQLINVSADAGSLKLLVSQNGLGFRDLQSICMSFTPGYDRIAVLCSEAPRIDDAITQLNQDTAARLIYTSALSPAPDRQHFSYACAAVSPR